MTDDDTAAVPTQICRWIAILAGQGIEKGHWSQELEFFRNGMQLFKTRLQNVLLRSAAF